MKKILLILLVFAAIEMSAQETFVISWGFSSTPSQPVDNPQHSNKTIEVGDSIRWEWRTDGGSHNVDSYDANDSQTSSNGVSVEEFRSGNTVNATAGNPVSFTYEFTVVGDNPYRCFPHSGSMFGVISVVETLSAEDKFRLNLSAFPNPVQDDLTVSSLINISSVEVYSILGKKVLSKSIEGQNLIDLNMGNLKSGLYFVNVTAENGQESVLRVMKK